MVCEIIPITSYNLSPHRERFWIITRCFGWGAKKYLSRLVRNGFLPNFPSKQRVVWIWIAQIIFRNKTMQARVVENGLNKMCFSHVTFCQGSTMKQTHTAHWYLSGSTMKPDKHINFVEKHDIYIFPKTNFIRLRSQLTFPKKTRFEWSVFFPTTKKRHWWSQHQKYPTKGSHPGLYHCSFIQFSAFQDSPKKKGVRNTFWNPNLPTTSWGLVF